jgi:hypothetical protein
VSHHYFVAYVLPGGIGNTSVALALPIRTLEDVRIAERAISESHHGAQITVTNWIKFPDEGEG